MSTFPSEIHCGADGFTTMRLVSYDLSVEQWEKTPYRRKTIGRVTYTVHSACCTTRRSNGKHQTRQAK